MLAQQKITTTRTVTTSVTKTAKRGVSVVRRNSKGGEEGARDFGNTCVCGRRTRCRPRAGLSKAWDEMDERMRE